MQVTLPALFTEGLSKMIQIIRLYLVRFVLLRLSVSCLWEPPPMHDLHSYIRAAHATQQGKILNQDGFSFAGRLRLEVRVEKEKVIKSGSSALAILL